MRKSIILFLLLLLLLFVIFPRTGMYGFLFDRGKYEYMDESSIEIISDLDELSPKTRELAISFLEKCKENGLSVRITETYRTQARQDMLYKQGRTTSGSIVTWTRNSKHTKRR
ncbi:M15 family metallopeptidase [Tissierella pigra]|uniref:M15 family metallopeptidase n=1 Tax=Tissierella pigra TaxID=2607614 RepID=A0A6N7XKV9_9FIRM|nr:M15 family metallopeptidase [Tissierella pigra]MSU02711.1 M15 family metallopeptidase [Tissierella pigra]